MTRAPRTCPIRVLNEAMLQEHTYSVHNHATVCNPSQLSIVGQLSFPYFRWSVFISIFLCFNLVHPPHLGGRCPSGDWRLLRVCDRRLSWMSALPQVLPRSLKLDSHLRIDAPRLTWCPLCLCQHADANAAMSRLVQQPYS